jgi:hypothetical protein
VADAYLNGLERRLAAGEPVRGIASVASLFVSRVDGRVDPLLSRESWLRGRVAIANARLAYAPTSIASAPTPVSRTAAGSGCATRASTSRRSRLSSRRRASAPSVGSTASCSRASPASRRSSSLRRGRSTLYQGLRRHRAWEGLRRHRAWAGAPGAQAQGLEMARPAIRLPGERLRRLRWPRRAGSKSRTSDTSSGRP